MFRCHFYFHLNLGARFTLSHLLLLWLPVIKYSVLCGTLCLTLSLSGAGRALALIADSRARVGRCASLTAELPRREYIARLGKVVTVGQPPTSGSG